MKNIRALFIILALFVSACGGDDESSTETVCPLQTAQWVPSVTGMGSSNHDPAVSVSSTVYSGSGPLIGLAQAVTDSNEITFTLDMQADLGANGSLTLEATTAGFPSELVGDAFPMLTELSCAGNDWVNLTKTGSGGDCAQSGFFTCAGSSCSVNASCTVNATSAYFNRTHYQQFQIPPFGYVSTNTFPTCNHTVGSPVCDFNGTFFSSGKLPNGINCTMKYALVASNYSFLSGFNAGITVTAYKKTDNSAKASSGNGAMNLNVILVGDKNISDSQSAKGQQNLNALLTHVFDHYNQTGVGVKLGTINAFEWPCSQGNAYANIDVSQMGSLLKDGSALVPAALNTQAMNIFLVSSIGNSSSTSTILGAAGAILTPLKNGTRASGVAFSTFNQLAIFNSACNGTGTCPLSSQEAQFVDMGATFSHEIGHALGLNHPSESNGATHDSVPDTPTCPGPTVTHQTCKTACGGSCSAYNASTCTFIPSVAAFQPNHLMFWSSKNFCESTDTGDNNIISGDSSYNVNYSPNVR